MTTSLLALCVIAAAWAAYLGHEAADDDRLRPGWLLWLISPLVVLWWLIGQAACNGRPFVDDTCPVLYTQASDLLVLPVVLTAFGGALLLRRRSRVAVAASVGRGRGEGEGGQSDGRR